MKFALYFANRGFFPETLVAKAREEMKEAVRLAGHESVCLDEKATKFGAISNEHDGMIYAEWLKAHRDEIDGVIMCLPNFGDESGAVKALRDWGKPILIQAYPDEIGKMSFAERRDSFCGKISICNYFNQCNIKYTIFEPHVIHPLDKGFIEQIRKFGKICRIYKGAKKMVIGALGARVTAFKTVRYDEVTLEKNNITVESFDLSELFYLVDKLNDNSSEVLKMIKNYKDYTDVSKVPSERLTYIAKTTLVILDYVKQYNLDAIAIRCWNEFPAAKKISVCLISSYLTNMGIPVACEVDVYNALVMKILTLASETPSAVMDWNNNYGTEKNKCIFYHCGQMATAMVRGKTAVESHKMFDKTYGEGCSYGVNVGVLKGGPITYASAKAENGKLEFYVGEGKITDDKVEKAFFGSWGIAEFNDLEKILMYVIKKDYHHHVTYTYGLEKDVVKEGLETYLGWKVDIL
ncbi:MAG: hypothetical protein BWX74_00331 [Tenericutes bacterium ADurb.Bin087]|nr:MAG: hypothetical protein BWX74_00331 [Tenericutes bacterium ADurb.Bin087]